MTTVRVNRRKTPDRRKRVEWTWHWRSMAAVVYLAICLMDFLIMPAYREYSFTRIPLNKMVEIARTMDTAAQLDTLRILKEDRAWTPVTNDVFHLAFGAILGVSALPVNRLARRKEEDVEEEQVITTDEPLK